MPVLRSTALIDAAPRTVAGLLRDVGLTAAAWRRDRHRVSAGVRLLAPGDQIDLRVRLLPWVVVPLRLVVGAASRSGLIIDLVAGPLPELRHAVTLTPTPAGTLVLDELRWTTPHGPLGRGLDVVLLRRLVLRAQAARLALLAARAAALVDAPVVVATALRRGDRLLIAQRTRPPELAGRWELPGGRVQPGEPEPAAVRRECQEELGVAVQVDGRVGTDLPITAGLLRVHLAELAPGAPEPRPLEHAALRWVGADELDGIDWVDADRAVVPDLVELLAAAPAGPGPGDASGHPPSTSDPAPRRTR
jgi:8-oxo-dGTP diphosphatase